MMYSNYDAVRVGDLVEHVSMRQPLRVTRLDEAHVTVWFQFRDGREAGHAVAPSGRLSSTYKLVQRDVPSPSIDPFTHRPSTQCFCDTQELLWVGHRSTCGAAKRRV